MADAVAAVVDALDGQGCVVSVLPPADETNAALRHGTAEAGAGPTTGAATPSTR